MNIVIIDDETPAIEELKYYLKEYDVTIKGCYTNPIEALNKIEQDKADMVFVDMDMPCMGGIELAVAIQKKLYEIIIVFVTAYSQYALEAYRVHPIDYVLKPIYRDAFKNTMQHAFKQYQLITSNILQQEENDVIDAFKINCFGKFEILKNGSEVMRFKTKKAKELFVYFICNTDKVIYRDEMIRTLFKETDITKSLNNFYVTLHRLRSALENFGINKDICNIIENSSVYIKDGICNYVDFCRFITKNWSLNEESIKDCQDIVNQYHGELFSDIDEIWVDEARVWLDIQMESLILKMATYYVNKLKYNHAVQVLLHLIEINPLSSMAYEMLLDIYMKQENWNGYRILYKNYKNLMKEELKLEISKKYIDYYKKNLHK